MIMQLTLGHFIISKLESELYDEITNFAYLFRNPFFVSLRFSTIAQSFLSKQFSILSNGLGRLCCQIR